MLRLMYSTAKFSLEEKKHLLLWKRIYSQLFVGVYYKNLMAKKSDMLPAEFAGDLAFNIHTNQYRTQMHSTIYLFNYYVHG